MIKKKGGGPKSGKNFLQTVGAPGHLGGGNQFLAFVLKRGGGNKVFFMGDCFFFIRVFRGTQLCRVSGNFVVIRIF